MEAIGGMKIFAMNDCDWYAARTEEEALQCMADTLSCKSVDECRAEYVQDGLICELSEESLDVLKFHDEGDGQDPETERTLTFRELLTELTTDVDMEPTFLASTEF
jgi:hypothetical protein